MTYESGSHTSVLAPEQLCKDRGGLWNEFLIPNVTCISGLLFADRFPRDRAKAIENFSVSLTDTHLSATAQVWAGYYSPTPVGLFEKMARHWSGWAGELNWASLEGELSLCCTCDRLGHIAIRVRLRSGFMPDDWDVTAAVKTEAGQLEAIARRAKAFFGREAEY